MVRPLRWQWAVLASALMSARAFGITIDDFTVGSLSETGPGTYEQTGLDPNHVVGGHRFIRLGSASFTNVLEIDTTAGHLDFSSGNVDMGYLFLAYGYADQLGISLIADGHDRIRFRFSYVTAAHPFGAGFYIRSSASKTAHSLETGLVALSGGGGVLELPLVAPGVDFSHVNSMELEIHRYAVNAGFVLESITTAGPPLPGDYNRDGVVDGFDYNDWRRLYGRSVSGGFVLGPDGNGDGRIDTADYILWRKNFGATTPAGSSTATVPEPASICFAAMAILGLAVTQQRRLHFNFEAIPCPGYQRTV